MVWLHWLRLASPNFIFRARLLVLGPMIVAALACERPTPTYPPSASAPSLSPEVAALVAVPLEDARARLLPALADGPLTRALDDLALALERGEGAAVIRALDGADRALVPLTSGEGAEEAAPEVEAVRLLLAEARALIEAPAPRR